MSDCADVGRRVREAREGLGLTLREAGDQSGMTARAWESVEHAHALSTPMSAVVCVFRFLVAAGVSARWLVTGEGGMGGPE